MEGTKMGMFDYVKCASINDEWFEYHATFTHGQLESIERVRGTRV